MIEDERNPNIPVRFRSVPVSSMESSGIQDLQQETPTFYNDLGSMLAVEPLVDLLNELHEGNVAWEHLAKFYGQRMKEQELEIDELKRMNNRLRKSMVLMDYQLKVQDRILKEYGE